MKTIEEKASAYAGTQDSDAYAGFVDGAEWMLDKVMDLLEDCEVFDRLGGRPVKAEDFRKALEE